MGTINRRQLLAATSVAAGSASVVELLTASGNALSAAGVGTQDIDVSVLNFWTREVRAPSEAFANKIAFAGGPVYQPAFVYYDESSATGVFQAPGAIDDTKLPEKGSQDVQVRVQRVRPSTTSKVLFETSQNGSLRIDLKQTANMPGLAETLAWSAIAALVPDSEGKLPNIKDLTFDPGTSWGKLQKIPLTNGLGFWSWNFFLNKQNSIWGRFVDFFRSTTPVFPLLGLPAIATTALTALDKVFGWWQATDKSDWLFKSVDSPVYATQEGKAALGTGGLPLKTGQYLVIPRDQLADFGTARDNLELRDGYLVPHNTDPFNWPSSAMQQIPAVDYLSLHVQVTPSKPACSTDSP